MQKQLAPAVAPRTTLRVITADVYLLCSVDILRHFETELVGARVQFVALYSELWTVGVAGRRNDVPAAWTRRFADRQRHDWFTETRSVVIDVVYMYRHLDDLLRHDTRHRTSKFRFKQHQHQHQCT